MKTAKTMFVPDAPIVQKKLKKANKINIFPEKKIIPQTIVAKAQETQKLVLAVTV